MSARSATITAVFMVGQNRGEQKVWRENGKVEDLGGHAKPGKNGRKEKKTDQTRKRAKG